MIKINGIQVYALELIRRCSYVPANTRRVLERQKLIQGYGLTELGAKVYQDAYSRRILGGRVEFRRIYRF